MCFGVGRWGVGIGWFMGMGGREGVTKTQMRDNKVSDNDDGGGGDADA